MIVVDTSVLAPLFIPGDLSDQAQKAVQKDSSWIAPRLWRSEFRNVLATYLRVQKITLDKAIETISKAEDFLRDREYEISSAAILDLASRSRLSAYDCEFIVLAQQFGVPLLTADRKLMAAFPETAIPVRQWLAS